MGYVPLLVLSIENLAVSLLLMATVFALVGRFRWRWMGFVIWIPLSLFIFLGYLSLTILTCFPRGPFFRNSMWFYSALALMMCFLVGLIWLCIAGVKRKKNNPIVPAANWPLFKLILAFIVAAGLHWTTIWHLDYQAQQQQALSRIEASVLGLSVAPPRVPDRDNAAFLYEEAARILDIALKEMPKEPPGSENAGQTAWDKWLDSFNKPEFDPKDPSLDQFLQQQSGTIALILEATKKPGCYFEFNYNRPDSESKFPETQFIRNIVRLLTIDANWKSSKENVQAALKDVNAMFVIANHLRDESIMGATFLACSIDNMSIETLQTILATHQLKQEELDIVKFGRILSYQKLMQRVLRFEEATQLNILSEDDILDYLSGTTSKKYEYLNSFYRIFYLENDIKYQRRYSEIVEYLASKPYYQSKDNWHKLLKYIDDNAAQSLIVALSYVGLNTYVESMARADAQYQVVELALAMCRYRAKNGKYPEKLDDLVPDFIASVPLDPFDGKPIRLKQTDGKLVIYSIGPDGIDDGGARFDPQNQKGDITFELPNKRD